MSHRPGLPNPPVDKPRSESTDALQDFADRLYAITQLVCGGNFVKLMELHDDMLRKIRERDEAHVRRARRRT